MLHRSGLGACLLLMMISIALAQPTAPAPDSSESMETPLPGDHWTYEIHDDITGYLKFTTTNVITDVTANEISLRMENLGMPGVAYFVYDRSWNVKNSPIWKFSPSDGTGVSSPLKAGNTWKIQGNDLYAARGVSWKRSGTSKIAGEESITTKAGTFDTFKIETAINVRNANDPTKKSELAMTTWYVPSINHWVKRTSKTTSDGHVNEQTTTELVEYGRR